jgi:hypothetical protein
MTEYLDYEGLSYLLSKIKSNVKPWIGVDGEGSSSKFLNEKGQFTEVQLPEMSPTEVTDLMNSLQ